MGTMRATVRAVIPPMPGSQGRSSHRGATPRPHPTHSPVLRLAPPCPVATCSALPPATPVHSLPKPRSPPTRSYFSTKKTLPINSNLLFPFPSPTPSAISPHHGRKIETPSANDSCPLFAFSYAPASPRPAIRTSRTFWKLTSPTTLFRAARP
jgi:hypothetical protein